MKLTMLWWILLIFSVSLTLAQQSSSYKMTEHAINGGGHPADGTILVSGSFRVTLDAIGDAAARPGLGSASFRMDGGFVSRYPPPGEVRNVRFSDSTTMSWDPNESVGVYHLYRDDACVPPDLTVTTATVPEVPAAGSFYSYLVTAENRLSEEGTQGYESGGSERTNSSPCP